MRGCRILTAFGRANLTDWYELTLQVPVWEQEMDNPYHAHHDKRRQTWYPVSEASLSALRAQMGWHGFDVRNA